MGADLNGNLNGKWKWIAGVAAAILMMAGSGAGGMAWSAYEKHDLALGLHGEAIVRLTTMAEAQQKALERIEKALVRLER
jgi:hypothetical protein